MKARFADVPLAAVASYWDERPCNIRHSPLPFGGRDYFDAVEARKYFVEPHIRPFAEFDRWRGKRVLEVGCGIGTDTISFARAGAHVTAVDISSRSLDAVRTRAAVYGLSAQVSLVHADAESLPDAVATQPPFDLVYSFGVLHHTPHAERAFAQLAKYAAPGGTVKVMVYNRRSWKVLAILAREGRGRFWALPEVVARHSEAQTGCPVTYTYTRRELRQILERNALRVIECRIEHIFPWRVSDYVDYRYVKGWPWRLVPTPAFRALERRAGWHLCATAVA